MRGIGSLGLAALCFAGCLAAVFGLRRRRRLLAGVAAIVVCAATVIDVFTAGAVQPDNLGVAGWVNGRAHRRQVDVDSGNAGCNRDGLPVLRHPRPNSTADRRPAIQSAAGLATGPAQMETAAGLAARPDLAGSSARMDVLSCVPSLPTARLKGLMGMSRE